MKINQLSIFLENKSGRLNEVLEALASADIRIIAASVADTSEFGILRILTSDPERAYEVLKGHSISTHRSDVIAIQCDTAADQFAKNLKHFASAGISIEYMYSFSVSNEGYMILKPNNIDAAIEVARAAELKLVSLL